MSKRKSEWQNRYISKRYDRINLLIEKDGKITKSDIKGAADSVGESVNAFITKAIAERIERMKLGQ